jgi:hypothetical protein
MTVYRSVLLGMRCVSEKLVQEIKTRILHNYFSKIVKFMRQCGKKF